MKNKEDLARKIADEVGIKKKDAMKALDIVFEEIKSTMVSGDTVRISSFGSFTTKERGERTCRNPITGEKVVSPKTTIPVFRPLPALKDFVNQK